MSIAHQFLLINFPLLFLGGIGVQELIVLSFVLLVPAALWITAIILLVKAKQDSTTKLIWVLVIIFIPFLGSLLYLIVGRNQNLIA